VNVSSSKLVVSNAPPVLTSSSSPTIPSIISAAPNAPSTTLTSFLLQDYCQTAEYKKILNELLIIKKHDEKTFKKCHHCKINRKSLLQTNKRNNNVSILNCDCFEEKTVCEKLLIQKKILK